MPSQAGILLRIKAWMPFLCVWIITVALTRWRPLSCFVLAFHSQTWSHRQRNGSRNGLLGDNTGSLVSPLACHNGNGQGRTTVWFSCNHMWRGERSALWSVAVMCLCRTRSWANVTRHGTERRNCLSVCLVSLRASSQRSEVSGPTLWLECQRFFEQSGFPLATACLHGRLDKWHVTPKAAIHRPTFANQIKCRHFHSGQLVNRSGQWDEPFLLVFL